MCRVSSSFIVQVIIHDSSWLDCYHDACNKNNRDQYLYDDFCEVDNDLIYETSSIQSIEGNESTISSEESHELINEKVSIQFYEETNIMLTAKHLKYEVSHRVSHKTSHKITDIITFKVSLFMNIHEDLHQSECNHKSFTHHENEFFYNSNNQLISLQHIIYICVITLSVDDDSVNLKEVMIHENWLKFLEVMKIEINSHWLYNIYKIMSYENVSVSILLFTEC